MLLQMKEHDGKLYSRLYVSREDIRFASYCAGVLLKKGWHGLPWERRGSIYQQQSVFTSALITAYARPFTNSKGWPTFSAKLIPYNAAELELHKRLIDLRNKVYAHSDSEGFSIRPWRSSDFSTAIVGAPVLRLTVEEATLFQVMVRRLQASITAKLDQLTADASVQPNV